MLDIAAILAGVRVPKWPPTFCVTCPHCGQQTDVSPQILERMAEAGRTMVKETGAENTPEMYICRGGNNP